MVWNSDQMARKLAVWMLVAIMGALLSLPICLSILCSKQWFWVIPDSSFQHPVGLLFFHSSARPLVETGNARPKRHSAWEREWIQNTFEERYPLGFLGCWSQAGYFLNIKTLTNFREEELLATPACRPSVHISQAYLLTSAVGFPPYSGYCGFVCRGSCLFLSFLQQDWTFTGCAIWSDFQHTA